MNESNGRSQQFSFLAHPGKTWTRITGAETFALDEIEALPPYKTLDAALTDILSAMQVSEPLRRAELKRHFSSAIIGHLPPPDDEEASLYVLNCMARDGVSMTVSDEAGVSADYRFSFRFSHPVHRLAGALGQGGGEQVATPPRLLS